MKRSLSPVIVLALFACAGCSQNPFTTHSTPQVAQQKTVQTNYASDGQDCNARAQSRMTMYDKPDTYPISDTERHDAYLALYSACMREHSWQVAGPVHAPATDASKFANLSPAAGGSQHASSTTVNAGNMQVSTSSMPGATVVVIGGNKETPAQLSSLSPASGGSSPSQNSTVVFVQSPPAPSAPSPVAAYAPTTPLPVAIPIPPKPATPTPYTVTAPSLQPSLAGAETATTGTAPTTFPLATQTDNQQLDNALEK